MAVSSKRPNDMERVDTWKDRHGLGLHSELEWQMELLKRGIHTQQMYHEEHRPDIVCEDTGEIFQVKNCLRYKHGMPGLLCEEKSYKECIRGELEGEDVWLVFHTKYGWRKQRPSRLKIVREPTAYARGSSTRAFTFYYSSTVEA